MLEGCILEGESRREIKGNFQSMGSQRTGHDSAHTHTSFIHEEPDATSSLISRVSALGCLDDAKGRSPELANSLAGISEDPLVHQALPSCWSL